MKTCLIVIALISSLVCLSQTKKDKTKTEGKTSSGTTAETKEKKMVVFAGVRNYIGKKEILKDSLIAAKSIEAYTFENKKKVPLQVMQIEFTCLNSGAVRQRTINGASFNEESKKIFEKIAPGKSVFLQIKLMNADGVNYFYSFSYKVLK